MNGLGFQKEEGKQGVWSYFELFTGKKHSKNADKIPCHQLELKSNQNLQTHVFDEFYRLLT